ncbi:hypothetical protein KM043_014023 [Ampulex compressa]|nr:hypothetical protein KM043_014023 [Ampulex compressa]
MVNLDSDTLNPFEIIVGTYEQYVLGYKVENIVNNYRLERSFATHSHLASVRSVASNKHYLATTGADDSVCLYDMRHRIESGKLTHHSGTVNCAAFTPDASHLFTCSDDGTIAAVRCGSWQLEKHWLKPHKGLAVNTLAIHPTGKIALSTGADGILRTWNLIKGRQAYATNLVPRLRSDAKNIAVVKWSPSGTKYLLAVNQRIDVYSVELAGVKEEIKIKAKVACVEFLSEDLIAIGMENGEVGFYDLEKQSYKMVIVVHDIRVKCIAHRDDLLVTASSSGEIKLWRFFETKLNLLQTINCGARITCLSLANLCKNVVHQKEIEIKEEKPVNIAAKFRLQQEVIVEDEGDWKVTPIKTPNVKSKKKKTKKKRNTKITNTDQINTETVTLDSQEFDDTQDEITVLAADNNSSGEPNTKKQRSILNDKINISRKKRKAVETSTNTHLHKKLRRKNLKTNKESKSTLPSTSTSLSSSTKNANETILNKKKKAVVDTSNVPLKRKKRK